MRPLLAESPTSHTVCSAALFQVARPEYHNVIAGFATSPIFNLLLCIFPQTIRRAVPNSGQSSIRFCIWTALTDDQKGTRALPSART